MPCTLCMLSTWSRVALSPPPTSQNEDCVSVLGNLLEDEPIRRLNLHPIGAPAENVIRCRIPASDEVHPKRVVDLGFEEVCRKRHIVLFRLLLDSLMRALDVIDNRRRLDKRVRRDHMDGLRAFLLRQLSKCLPDKLQRGPSNPCLLNTQSPTDSRSVCRPPGFPRECLTGRGF